MRQILPNENSQEELAQKGYTKISLLSPEEVDYLSEKLWQLQPDDKFAPEGEGNYEKTYHLTFLDTNADYKQKANELIQGFLIDKAENKLINFKVLAKNFFIKPSGKGELNVHRNWTFIEDYKDTTVTVWCPLVDVDESNGTLQVVEGSHKIMPEIVTPTAPPFFDDFKDAIIEKYSKPIFLKAGEALVFDDKLIHWSDNNKSKSPRPAVVMACVPADVDTVFYYLDYSSNNNEFEVFQINTDFFKEFVAMDLSNPPTNLRSLGFVKNNNRMLSEQEFIKILNGDHKSLVHTTGTSSIITRIKSVFRRG